MNIEFGRICHGQLTIILQYMVLHDNIDLGLINLRRNIRDSHMKFSDLVHAFTENIKLLSIH